MAASKNSSNGMPGGISKTWLAVGGVALIVIIGVLWWLGTYNTLVAKDEGVQGQWGNVQSSYQRRFDLIPNLVNTAKGIMNAEVALFEEFAKARQAYAAAGSVNAKVAAANQLESTISKFLFVSENYPELKSQANFLELQAQLEGTENRISVERMRFNDAVRDYSAFKRSFPANFIAGGFPDYEYFESKAGADVVPQVTFP